MELHITREKLLAPLQVVVPVIENKPSPIILANLYLTIKDSTLTLLGTDFETELSACCELVEQYEDFSITVPARKLMDICRAISEETPLSLIFTDNKVTIKTPSSRFSLPTLPASEFPQLEEKPGEQEFAISEQALKNMLQASHFAMAVQDVRFFLNGLLLAVSPTLITTVATDGHRLAASYLAVQAPTFPQADVLMPRKAVTELLRLLDENEVAEVTCVMGDNHLRVIAQTFTFATKLIDAKFPDYQRVIPKRTPNELKVSRSALKSALMRVALLTDDKHKGVKLQAENGILVMSAKNRDVGEAEEEIAVELNGEPFLIALNINYLTDILGYLDSELIKINYNSPQHGIIVEAENDSKNLYVIMPMKL